MAGAASFIDLTGFQGFSTNPQMHGPTVSMASIVTAKASLFDIQMQYCLQQETGINVTGSMGITSTVDNSVHHGQPKYNREYMVKQSHILQTAYLMLTVFGLLAKTVTPE